jgi:hypothetical protein
VYQTPLVVLRCPADPDYRQNLWTDRADINNPNGLGGCAITNYKGVCGQNWAWGSPGSVVAASSAVYPGANNGLEQGDGILFRSMGTSAGGTPKSFTFNSITDGSSNTFLIGEDLPSHCLWTGCWVYANNTTGTCAIPLNYYDNPVSSTAGDWNNCYSFASAHGGGGNFACCDGTVHFVNQSITTANYRALSTPRSGDLADVSQIQ